MSVLRPSRVEVYIAKIVQMLLCAKPGQLFPGIPPHNISAYYRVSQCSCLHSLLIESLQVFDSPQFYEMLPQEEICIKGLLERKRRKKRKEKENCTTSVLYVRRSLQELAAQEELISVLFYKSFWCLSHHLYHEDE